MTNLNPDLQKLLEDIHSSALRVMDVLYRETRQSFLSFSAMDAQDIAARRLTVIGEAAAAILRKYPEFCEQNPKIPLRQARGMRNTLVHDYDGIKWELVWDTVQTELPKLIDSIAPFLFQQGLK